MRIRVCGKERKERIVYTYIRTKEGWLYLAVVLDLFSRRIVGWAMSTRITSDLVTNALKMAIEQRKPVHHKYYETR